MHISAVIVTRGNVDIRPITDTLRNFDEVIVWDNSVSPKDMKVFGRYAGAYLAKNDFIYIQDDDCVIDADKLVELSVDKPEKMNSDICVNFPVDRRAEYLGTEISLLGWGSIFPKSSLRIFDLYLCQYPFDDLFLRECDRIFSYLLKPKLVDIGVTHLPYAFGDDRMGREPKHYLDFMEIRSRLKRSFGGIVSQ